jgi:hypothetical protein
METETLDKLYLEYSQMTTARTWREIELYNEVVRLRDELIAAAPPGILTLKEIDAALARSGDTLRRVLSSTR